MNDDNGGVEEIQRKNNNNNDNHSINTRNSGSSRIGLSLVESKLKSQKLVHFDEAGRTFHMGVGNYSVIQKECCLGCAVGGWM